MLTDWIHWLSSIELHQLWAPFALILLIDTPRYVLGSWLYCLCDGTRNLWRRAVGGEGPRYNHCPSVCVILAGLNESETVGATLESVWGTYPRLEIVVVDDGSDDGMVDIARRFAQNHSGVTVIRRPRRGGKSSALNVALPFTQAEIVVGVDCDSDLGPNAIWEIVQPFSKPRVGAVSGTVLARNGFTNLVTRLQAFEYLRNIFVGRRLSAGLGILGIVSGAFGAFRRSVLEQTSSWDVGPGEDGDMTLRIRKAGHDIAFAPYAQCYTNVPESWRVLAKQRRRWEWGAVTFECRKHIDMANILSPNFRLTNLLLLLERWVFNVAFVYVFWIYVVWIILFPNPHLWAALPLTYLGYIVLEVIQAIIILSYSLDPKRDLKMTAVIPFAPFYQLFLKAVSVVAITEEFFFRKSWSDTYVPSHVQKATWHW